MVHIIDDQESPTSFWPKRAIRVLPPDADRYEWLEARQKGIGASDAPSILGCGFSTPLNLWAQKTGRVDGTPMTEAMAWGHRHEEPIAKFFSESHGGLRLEEPGLLKSIERPWQMATPDRALVGLTELLEIKTTDATKAWEWERGKVPERVMAQVQHQLAVTGYTACWIAVLIGGNRYEERYVNRWDTYIDNMNVLEEEFWVSHVVADTPPEPSARDAATLTGIWSTAVEGAAVDLPSEASLLIDEYIDVALQKKAISSKQEEIANRLRFMLGEAEAGQILDKTVVTWKNSSRTSLDIDKLRTDEPDIYKKYSKTTQIRRLTVKGE